MIKDSGQRTEFETGAVRDIQENKGRCDLIPLDVAAWLIEEQEAKLALLHISDFVKEGGGLSGNLYIAIRRFCNLRGWTLPECLLEVSKHYCEGSLKYGERNWEKGIPLHSYIDSGVRHLLKYIDGQIDEPHDRAFVWNMLGALWTLEHKPELNDLPFAKREGEKDGI
jgi:hypothetical protein